MSNLSKINIIFSYLKVLKKKKNNCFLIISLSINFNFGNVRDKIKVRANFFKVTALPEEDIVYYDVTITPNVPPRLNRIVFQRFVETNLRGFKPVYDGTLSNN
jgi:N-terminal domain of argonaute